MINDLKKFGLPNIKNIKVEILRPGHGEVVCQLIDELVNLELYRRDFEFMEPTMPAIGGEEDNNSGDEYDDENAQDDRFQGRNEIINGIEIQTHSLNADGIASMQGN